MERVIDMAGASRRGGTRTYLNGWSVMAVSARGPSGRSGFYTKNLEKEIWKRQ